MKKLQIVLTVLSLFVWLSWGGLDLASAQSTTQSTNGAEFYMWDCLTLQNFCKLGAGTFLAANGTWTDASGSASGQINLSMSTSGYVPGIARYVDYASVFYSNASSSLSVTATFAGVSYTFNTSTASGYAHLPIHRWLADWQNFSLTNAHAVVVVLEGTHTNLFTPTPTGVPLGTFAYPTSTPQAASGCGIFGQCSLERTPTPLPDVASNPVQIPVLISRQAEIDQANSVINTYRLFNRNGLISIAFVAFSIIGVAAVFVAMVRRTIDKSG